MFSAGVDAVLIQARVQDLARHARKFNEGRILGEAGATHRRQPSLLDRESERLQDRGVLEGRASGMQAPAPR